MSQINPEDDFAGYMEDLQKQQSLFDRQRALVEEHEQWRQTTWTGWMVRQLQRAGNYIAPFIMTIDDVFTRVERENTASQIVLTILLRVLMVSGYVVALYAITKIISSVLGRDIILEEEIVVEYEGDEPPVLTPEQIAKIKADAAAAKRGQAQPQPLRKVRGKKNRNKKKES